MAQSKLTIGLISLLCMANSVSADIIATKAAVEATITVLPLAAQKDRSALWKALQSTGSASLNVAPQQSLIDAVRAKCGSAPPDLLKHLASMNPGESETASQARSLSFIPCPYWYFGPDGKGVSVNTQKGENLQALAKQFVGSDGPETLEKVRELNPAIFDESGTAKRDGVIVLPYVSRPIQLPVQGDGKRQVNAVIAALPAKAKFVALHKGTPLGPGEYQLVATDSIETIDPKADCGDDYDEAKWPVNLAALERAVLDARAKLPSPPNFGLILIADTGVSTSDKDIETSLWRNPNVDNGFVSSFNYKDDLHGASMVTRRGDVKSINPPANDYPLFSHGSDISLIIIEAGRRQTKLQPLTRLAVARLNEPDPPYKIGVQTIPVSIAYARAIEADVVNLSVVIGSPDESLKTALQSSRALIVAAAGNAGKQVEGLNIYPPGLSEPRGRMIVVGAHDWGHKISTFSNIGSRVDILAPGCAIPIVARNGTRRLVSGTSFAAPFVSTIAALLRAVGVPSNPVLMRRRILAAGHYVRDLEGVTKYGVILEPERTLRAKQDSIWLKASDSPLFGELDDTQTWVCIGNNLAESYSTTTTLKFISLGVPDGVRIWKRPEDEGDFEIADCKSGFADGVMFKAEGLNDFTRYEWSALNDVVPRLR